MSASPASDLTERVHRICEEFGYPAPIRQALLESAEIAVGTAPRAVLLVGSAARGELTYRAAGDGRLEMFSDLEMICIGDSERQPEVDSALGARTRRWEESLFLPNGLFHVDCLLTRAIRSGPEARGLLWYEAGRTHRLLWGEHGDHFGELDPSRVSLGLLAQLTIVRLFWMLVQLPIAGLESGGDIADEHERELFLYSQIRNLLDVASIWLPHEGVFECGYRSRLAYLQGNADRLGGTEHFGPGIVDHVADATRRKLECDLAGDPLEWYLRTVGAYEALTAFLAGAPVGAPREALMSRVRSDWADRNPVPVSWKFRGYAAGLTARSAAIPGAGIRWLRSRAHPDSEALCLLLEMHAAARAQITGDEAGARAALSDAADALWLFSGRRPSAAAQSRGTYAGEWHALRVDCVRAIARYFRKLRGHLGRIEVRMEQESNRLTDAHSHRLHR